MFSKKNKIEVRIGMFTSLVGVIAIILLITIGFSMVQKKESASTEAITETSKVVLIKGKEKSANKYERVEKLSYTNTTRYTKGELSQIDQDGLQIMREEIYARHGKMFDDVDIQNYFQRQDWYKPQYSSNEFDDSCLNDVERDNIKLICESEQKME